MVFKDGASLWQEKGGQGLRPGVSLARMNAAKKLSVVPEKYAGQGAVAGKWSGRRELNF